MLHNFKPSSSFRYLECKSSSVGAENRFAIAVVDLFHKDVKSILFMQDTRNKSFKSERWNNSTGESL